MATPLDQIFADEPSVHALPEGPGGEPSAETSAEPDVETGTGEPVEAKPVATKGGTKSEPATGDDDDEVGGPDPKELSADGLRKALLASRGDTKAEKKKRRELLRELDQLKGQVSVLQQQRTPATTEVKKNERPDFYADPDAHISAREMALREEWKADQFKRDATRSERAMMRQHEDYNEAKAAFMVEVQKKPYLWQQVFEDPDPAEIVYAEGKKLLAPAGDEVAQLRARLAAYESGDTDETESEVETSKKPVTPIPRSIATRRGSGASTKPAFKGRTPLEKIFE